MARLALWDPPLDEDVDQIEISSGPSAGSLSTLTTINARNGYENWVTHFLDDTASADTYYQVGYLKNSVSVQTSPVALGVVPLGITPQDVIDTIQGLPANLVSAKLVQRYIEQRTKQAETHIHQALSVKASLKERYGKKVYERILGAKAGAPIQLRHFPIVSIDKIYYEVRGTTDKVPHEITGIDKEIEDHDPVTGYNRGRITVWATNVSLEALFAGLNWTRDYVGRVQILFDYKHGWEIWPDDIKKAVTELAAASVMEVMGEAQTAGLSSRSVDGYSESFTASATTTVFSARRLWYEKEAKSILDTYKKPIWG